MNTYSDPLVISYDLGNHDFGAGAGTQVIQGPEGHKGRVKNVLLKKVTEAFTADTTAGLVRVGTAADPDKFAEVSLGTTAIAANKSSLDAELFNAEIAADEAVHTDFVAPTGGVPAGIGDVMITIGWYK